MLGRSSVLTGVAVLCLIVIAGMAGCRMDEQTTGPNGGGQRIYVEDLDLPLDGELLTSLDLETMNGKIAVTGVGGTNGVIHVRKKIRAESDSEAAAFADKVKIHVERAGGSVRVHATYPPPPRRVSVEVSYDVDCRAGANLELRTINGGIEISGTRAAVNATTVNGGIHADLDQLDGEGRFSSTSGSIDVRMARCRVPITATTINGDIDVALPGTFAGLLHAQTANGRIRCDIPLSRVYVRTSTILSGRIGTGLDTPVTLQTANGSVGVRGF